MKNQITDMERYRFLVALGGSNVLLNEWEEKFAASFRHSGSMGWFTPARRHAADMMRLKHGLEVGMPMLLARPGVSATDVCKLEAEPGGCEYFVRPDGVAKRSNEPARLMRESGFRYCERHADEVLRALKRRGLTMRLIPVKHLEAA